MKEKILNQIQKMFRTYGISMLYENEVGIKALNPVMTSELLNGYSDRSIQLLDPKYLKLGIDGLKDNFTLLDILLDRSPHFLLMRQLNEFSKILPTSDYYQRSIKGTLDFRRAKLPDTGIKKFKEKKENILNNEYHPIFISNNNGHNYIIDGKHRAALCLLLGKQVKTISICDFFRDSHFRWLIKQMKKSKNSAVFSKHQHFFKQIFAD